MNPDSQLYTNTATAIRAQQHVTQRETAMDLEIELRNRKERETFHSAKVEELEAEVAKLTAQWQKLNNAIAAAEKLLDKRPWLKEDIATWKREMDSVEEDGNKVKRVLESNVALFKQAKSDLKPLTEKNPRGFDYVKLKRLQEEEKGLL